MNLRNVKVSVIMACFNSSAFLDESVNSVLNQTLGDLELILIDDCSTDNTFEIARRYQMQDDRVSVLSLQANSGPALARNAGIMAARGEWLGILDSDDIAMPTRIEEQIRLADSDKNLVMIGSGSISIHEKGHAIKEHKYPTGHKELVKRLVTMRVFPPHSSMIYRRDAVQGLASFNMRFSPAEDYDLWLRLSRAGKISSINKPLVKIRKHDAGISNWEGGMLQIRLGVAASICHFLRVHGYSDPSVTNDETRWVEFVTWIERRLVAEGVFEKYKAWADARSKYFAAKNSLTGAFSFVACLMQSGRAGALAWEKIFGFPLPQRLAQKWMATAC